MRMSPPGKPGRVEEDVSSFGRHAGVEDIRSTGHAMANRPKPQRDDWEWCLPSTDITETGASHAHQVSTR
jgi:hypothetical protein